MILQVKLQDLRNMIKEKCEEIIADKKLAYELYWRICDIEEDERFVDVTGEMPGLIDGNRLIDWLRIVELENGMINPDVVVDYIREMQAIKPEPPKEEDKCNTD